jgi:hypothetical protein
MAKEERTEQTTPIDFSKDVDSDGVTQAIPTNERMTEVSQLAHRVTEIELMQEELKAKAAELTRELWRITTDSLPSKMLELGLNSFTLDDGSKISLGTGVQATWPKEGEDHVRAVEWMRDNGYADLIKDIVAVQFGKGEVDRADELIAVLDREGFGDWSRKEDVHHQTLKAWIREMTETGKSLPLDLFHAEIFTLAKVKLPK